MLRLGFLLCMCLSVLSAADVPDLLIQTLQVKGAIEGENIGFTIETSVKTKKPDQSFVLINGAVVLSKVAELPSGVRLVYDATTKAYVVHVDRRGEYTLHFQFAAKPDKIEGGLWRECSFHVPVATQRELQVRSDRDDVELKFPGALKLERSLDGQQPVFTALLGPGHPFTVRWQPQVNELDAKLVVASHSNTILSAHVGVWHIDALFKFHVAQGKMNECSIRLPADVHVTRVQGQHIRDWDVSAQADHQLLRVELNHEQTAQYDLHVLAEQGITAMPTAGSLPKLFAVGTMHNQGHLLVGSNSAIQVSTQKNTGLKQIDISAFPRAQAQSARRLPRQVLYAFECASDEWDMQVALSDIVSSFDSEQRMHVSIQDDEVVIYNTIELDIRDAAISQVRMDSFAGFTLADIQGKHVDTDASHVNDNTLYIVFKDAVMGRVSVSCRYELGKSPIAQAIDIKGAALNGARNQRGFVVISAEDGVQIAKPDTEELRQVHIGSLPLRVSDAQFAWRFRTQAWSLRFTAQKRRSGIRAEGFHLMSLGDGTAFGSLIMTYFVTGAPVDELHFTVKGSVKQLEFIGNDISSWKADGQHYTIKLSRKIIGDYNIGIYWQQRFIEKGELDIGIIQCEQVDTETGYMVVASRDHLQASTAEKLPGTLLEIDAEELPPSYRLPINAPVLKSYKYVDGDHFMPVTVKSFEQGELIPVVIEVMDMNTTISIREDTGDVESLTDVVYKIKNANSQFLTLTMPPDARIWSIQRVDQNKEQNITAAQDGNLVKIPLQRRRDPNQPMTIKMVYGQSHGVLGWSGDLIMQAPRSPMHSTFARWHMQVPDGLMISAEHDSNMQVVAQRFQQPQSVLEDVGQSWMQTIGSFVVDGGKLFCVLIAVVVLACLFFTRPVLFPYACVGAVLALLFISGILVANKIHIDQLNPPRQVTFDQALSLDQDQPMQIAVAIKDAWHFAMALTPAVIGGIISALAVLCAFFYRARTVMVLISVVTAYCGLVVSLQSIPACSALLVHMSTWVLPALLVLWLFRGQVAKLTAGNSASTAATVLMMIVLGGCSSARDSHSVVVADTGVIAHVACTAELGDDSADISMTFTISVEKDYVLPLLPLAAVVRNADALPTDVNLQLTDEYYALSFDRAGSYDLSIKYLLPLPDNHVWRTFTMPVPLALSNDVRVVVPESGMAIFAPAAIHFDSQEEADQSIAHAQFAPGESAVFTWRPRDRNTKDEVLKMYAENINIIRTDSGLIDGKHLLRLRIAQGEIHDIHLNIPKSMTVTDVKGQDIGAWRYDVETGKCEIKLQKAKVDNYVLYVHTQTSGIKLPYTQDVFGITVDGVERNRSVLGISSSSAVVTTVKDDAVTPMHIDDLHVQAKSLLKKGEKIRFAYRLKSAEESVTISSKQVQAEIRSEETGSFSISDERLLYVSKLHSVITKAGVFTLSLDIPQGYDIDSLQSTHMSHWDDEIKDGQQRVRMYLKNKTQGAVDIHLSLSKPISEIPKHLDVPRISLVNTLKHKGHVVISAERGLRLHVLHKQAVSEIEFHETTVRGGKSLKFRLLQANWGISLQPQVIQPVTNVQFLHDVHVTEGMLRHAWYMRYKMRNAGRKQFSIEIPQDAMGVLINAPDVARWDDVRKDGKRFIHVSLTRKYFEQSWPLVMRFETRFDRSSGQVQLLSTGLDDSDSMKGHVVVHGSDRVEVEVAAMNDALVSTESRSIPNIFGAGSMSDAAFCFKSGNGRYQLPIKATRHSSADVLQARVLNTHISTVFTERGESFNNVQLSLRVGKKRHLKTLLPSGSRIWSLRVDGIVMTPSKGADGLWLIPVAQGSRGDLPVNVELIYVHVQDQAWDYGSRKLTGPQFDLPLVDIDWDIYVPPAWEYSDVSGTLSVRRDSFINPRTSYFGIEAYEQQIQEKNVIDIRRAKVLQQKGKKLASQGKQYEAKQALEMARNYSSSDFSFNEDARVQLHTLNRQQCVVGFVSRRGKLRQQPGEWAENNNNDLGDQFRIEEAQRVQNALHKDDSDNLEKIIDHMIRMQEDAATVAPRMMITAPLHGQKISLHRNLQIKPDVPMFVTFEAHKKKQAQSAGVDWSSIVPLALGLFIALSIVCFIDARWTRIESYFTPKQGPLRKSQHDEVDTYDLDKDLIQEDEWQPLVEENEDALAADRNRNGDNDAESETGVDQTGLEDDGDDESEAPT